MFRLHKGYFFLAILFFIIEVLIALYVRDKIIRPYIGDYLVVIFLYCLVKSVTNLSVQTACILVLLFSFFIEFLQYLNIVERIGLQNSKLANTVLGNSFEWTDLILYTAGIVTVFIVDKMLIIRNY